MLAGPRQFEAFYYVATYGGIAAASRHMHGVGQPTISHHISEFEVSIGRPLFIRPGFALTEYGRRLYEAVKFYGGIEPVLAQIRSGLVEQLRIGVGEMVLRDYMRPVMAELSRRRPNLDVLPVVGFQKQLEEAVENGQADLAIGVIDDAPTTLKRQPLMQLPLVLLGPKKLKVTSAEEIFARRPIRHRLALPTTESFAARFQQELKSRDIDWPTTYGATMFSLVPWFVQEMDCIGLSLGLPGQRQNGGLRVLPLPDFREVSVGVMWREPASPLLPLALEVLAKQVEQLTAGRA